MERVIVKNLSEMIDFSKEFIKKFNKSVNICLVGELASGKTVFTKAVCEYFKIEEEIISPTFNILKSYKIKSNKYFDNLNHFDVYRIEDDKELLDIDFFDFIYEDRTINIIEWADLIKSSLKDNSVWIYINKISEDENYREILIDYDNFIN